MRWTVWCFINLPPTLMSLKVSEVLDRFIQVCVLHFASCITILQEQVLQNGSVDELMDEKRTTKHSHYGDFMLPRSAINGAFILTLKFCVFNKFQTL